MSDNIHITLGDNEFELVPSLKAAQSVSAKFNGFNTALQALAQNDLNAFTAVIRAGVKPSLISNEDLSEAIYLAGTRNLMEKTMRYVTRLANGGKDTEAE